MNWLSKQGKQVSKRLMDIVDELREMRDDAKESGDEGYWSEAYDYLDGLADRLWDSAHELRGMNDDPKKGGLWR